MDKLKMMSADGVEGNIEKIGALFPNCVTERLDENGKVEKAIDFEMLKQELSHVVVDGAEERYQFTWPDKKKSILLANAPINKTLRPVVCDEQVPTGADTSGQPYISSGSVGKNGEAGKFDSENLYIEGDNLDALKLLQETYMGKIKMIYIDPPYNTGKDFIYRDDFAMSSDEYMENSGQLDEQGNRLFQNNESNGRFHTDWLNIIYPRLKLAKDLLTDDGVIFISIDDNEVENLKKICNEVFGESNFVNNIVCIANPGGNKSDYIETTKQYILVFSKNKANLKDLGFSIDVDSSKYQLIDEIGNYRQGGQLEKWGNDDTVYTHPRLAYSIYYNPTTQDVKILYDYNKEELIKDRTIIMCYEDMDLNLINSGYFCIRPRVTNGNKPGRWRLEERTFYERLNSKSFMFVKIGETYKIYEKERLENIKFIKIKDVFESEIAKQNNDALEIFNAKIFSYPKPVRLIKYIINSCVCLNDKDAIVLDIFSGSATTAHAVMQLNAEDGGNRKFIMVQLPEVTDEKTEAYKAGYKNICEIGKERIRRAGKKIAEQFSEVSGKGVGVSDGGQSNMFDEQNKPSSILPPTSSISSTLDIGFRVLKLDTTNMKDVYYRAENYSQSLLDNLEGNIKADRKPQDLLLQVMLDMGVLLSSKIEEKNFTMQNGQCVMQDNTQQSSTPFPSYTVFIVGDYSSNIQPNLIACFDDNLSNEVVTAIAKMKPLYAVFRDSSFANDSVAANFEQIFTTYSPTTTRKVI